MGEASDEPEQQLTVEMAEAEMILATSRRRKRKSLVWEYFTTEAVGDGSTRARCTLCNRTFAYSNGSKVAGTSHLKRHIALGSCPKIKSEERKQLALASGLKTDDGSVLDPPRRRYRRTTSIATFDQDVSYENLAKMIIVQEYPILMVQQPAVVAFVQSLQPQFRMPTFDEIESEIAAVYLKEKQNLMEALGSLPGRICLSISFWTTSQSLDYVSLSCQFIDGDWKMHRRMLNFLLASSPESSKALSNVIEICLSEWNMNAKLFTITVDNNSCSSLDIYSANLRDHLSSKNVLVAKGQLFVVRCFASVLNTVAQDVIASIHGIVRNIRESVKFVKASTGREEKFAEMAVQLEIPSTKSLSLDLPTQWHTTYHMLAAALEFKEAFAVLETCDDDYNEAPAADDWKTVEAACMLLKLLHDSARAVTETADPTANVFFQEAWKIMLELTHAILSDDEVVRITAERMHENFDKYWKDCILVLAVAVVMDPRFKMKLVEFSFSKLYGEDAAKYVRMVDDAVHELYSEYVAPVFEVQEHGAGETTKINGGDGLYDFDIYISETVSKSSKPELEQYLEEALLPRTQEFDLLNWWKLNSLKYPTLSKMARDVLGIPMIMVGNGPSIFSMGSESRVLNEDRSSLRPETVEALFCAKDWLQYLPTVTENPPAAALMKMED